MGLPAPGRNTRMIDAEPFRRPYRTPGAGLNPSSILMILETVRRTPSSERRMPVITPVRVPAPATERGRTTNDCVRIGCQGCVLSGPASSPGDEGTHRRLTVTSDGTDQADRRIRRRHRPPSSPGTRDSPGAPAEPVIRGSRHVPIVAGSVVNADRQPLDGGGCTRGGNHHDHVSLGCGSGLAVEGGRPISVVHEL
jgi:hypothetical protein